jgi:hypothetical protein
MIYIFANGEGRMKPVVVFHGSPTEKGGKIEEGERSKCHDDVIGKNNKTAYTNEELMLESIETRFQSQNGVTPDDLL